MNVECLKRDNGAPADLYPEGAFAEFYPELSHTGNGASRIIRGFPMHGGFPKITE
jgi:phosphoketolase